MNKVFSKLVRSIFIPLMNKMLIVEQGFLVSISSIYRFSLFFRLRCIMCCKFLLTLIHCIRSGAFPHKSVKNYRSTVKSEIVCRNTIIIVWVPQTGNTDQPNYVKVIHGRGTKWDKVPAISCMFRKYLTATYAYSQDPTHCVSAVQNRTNSYI